MEKREEKREEEAKSKERGMKKNLSSALDPRLGDHPKYSPNCAYYLPLPPVPSCA